MPKGGNEDKEAAVLVGWVRVSAAKGKARTELLTAECPLCVTGDGESLQDFGHAGY